MKAPGGRPGETIVQYYLNLFLYTLIGLVLSLINHSVAPTVSSIPRLDPIPAVRVVFDAGPLGSDLHL